MDRTLASPVSRGTRYRNGATGVLVVLALALAIVMGWLARGAYRVYQRST